MSKDTQTHYLDQIIYMVEEEIAKKEREGKKVVDNMYLHLKNLKWFRNEFYGRD